MTDIRKDFDKWLGAPNDSWLDDPLSVGYIQWEAYQAGRAHDVDGLIAEIRDGVADKTLSTLAANGALYIDAIELFERIRKHFGKE